MESEHALSLRRLTILLEEVGEIAKEFNDAQNERRLVDVGAPSERVHPGGRDGGGVGRRPWNGSGRGAASRCPEKKRRLTWTI